MKSTFPHIVVLSANPETPVTNQNGKTNTRIRWVTNLEGLQEEANHNRVDGLVVENPSALDPFSDLTKIFDLPPTVVVAGKSSVTDAAARLHSMLEQGNQSHGQPNHHKNVTLDDYVESKFSEFVRAMNVSSARSLHDTLIRAVERPLIKLALQETNGNQIQAAQLLGMNRNTLRKKIVEFKISVKRRPSTTRHRSSAEGA